MTPERWRQVARVYQSALEQTPATRDAFVASACRDDSDLRREVESLLAREHAPVLVDQPVDVAAAAVVGNAPGLTAGSLVGPYRVTALIGEGGMGQVYRAHDTKLQRDVALKILPESFVHDPDRLARFTREAHVLASLNHPNIGAIHGFEDSGPVHALVLELVEGPTLADRIARGPLPVDEALAIARQIAEALEAAHEHGIVHRDLKPANIKVRDDGTVKVLDFGLAKPIEKGSGIGDQGSVGAGRLSMSPTITSPAMMTGVGLLLGTAAYMSPEQAKGKPADKRSDIWAFGCVLYEMLIAKRAFEGEDVSDTLASVLKSDPNWDALPEIPGGVRALLKTCLQKDRRKRTVDATTAVFVLENATGMEARHGRGSAIDTRTPSLLRHRLLAPLAAALVAGISVAGAFLWNMRPVAAPVVRTAVSTGGLLRSDSIALGLGRNLIITPDGSRIVYQGQGGFMVRALDNLSPQELRVPGQPFGAFMSPDGQSIGYFDSLQGTLKRIAISGGAPITIVREPMAALRGATWGTDGTIIYADSSPTNGLFRVPSAGGAPKLLTKVDRARGEGDHVFPEFLPGGKAVLFTIVPATGRLEDAQIAVLDLRTGTFKVLLQGGMDARYVPSGHLVYAVPGALRAVAFDIQRLDVIGTPVPVIDGVETQFAAQVAIAANGTLVYLPGGANLTFKRTLVWVNRSGREEAIAGLEPRAYQRPRLSRDGTRVALETTDQEQDIWIWDFRTRNLRRLTIDPGPDTYPVWTPDERIIFSSLGGGAAQNVYSRAADGSGVVEQLTRGERSTQPQTIRSDGSGLIVRAAGGSTRFDLLLLPLRPPGPERPLVATSEDEVGAELSPDGRWLAYQTTTSGPQIVVRPFPNVDDGYWQVSTGGGRMPMWSRNGRELFYLAPENTLMGVRVESGQSFQFTPPVPVLRGQYYYPGGPNSRTFDISPDGQRFLMLKEVGSDDTPRDLIVVQNWFEELKRLVPAR